MLNSQGCRRTLSWPILRHCSDIRQYKMKKVDRLSSDINCSMTPFWSWHCPSGCSVNRAIPFSSDVRVVWNPLFYAHCLYSVQIQRTDQWAVPNWSPLASHGTAQPVPVALPAPYAITAPRNCELSKINDVSGNKRR